MKFVALLATMTVGFTAVSGQGVAEGGAVRQEKIPQYQVKDFSYLIGMKGFSDLELNNHFKLYAGYVNNTNLLLSLLDQLAKDGEQGKPCWNEIKRRLSWEWDGMHLHEFYFENLGGTGSPKSQSEVYKAIERTFGSYDAWKEDFIATGMLRGIGWAVLYEDPQTGRLLNIWIAEHNMGELAGAAPLLIMDVWEHAYVFDYGLDRKAYINAFFNNINWDVVEQRFVGAQLRRPMKLEKPEAKGQFGR